MSHETLGRLGNVYLLTYIENVEYLTGCFAFTETEMPLFWQIQLTGCTGRRRVHNFQSSQRRICRLNASISVSVISSSIPYKLAPIS